MENIEQNPQHPFSFTSQEFKDLQRMPDTDVGPWLDKYGIKPGTELVVYVDGDEKTISTDLEDFGTQISK